MASPNLITYACGDSYTQSFTIKQPASQLAQNLTGWTVNFVVKAHAGIDDLVSILNVPCTLVDATAGIIVLNLNSVQTNSTRGVLVWVLRGIDGSGNRKTITVGTLIGKPT